MHLTYLAMLVSVSLSALLAAPAAASPDAGHAKSERARVESYLESHDVSSAAEVRGVSPSPDKTLIAIASDEHAERLIRSRAVAALRFLPSSDVQEFLTKLIQDKATATDPTDRLILRRAAIAVGWMAGADAPDLLATLFANEDVEVRVDAVLGISMSRAGTATGTLRKQLAVESAPRVRQQIERQLVALEAPNSQTNQAPAPEKAATSKKKQPSREPMRGGF